MKHHKFAVWYIDLGIEIARKTVNNPAEPKATQERCLRQIEKLTDSRDTLARDSQAREQREAAGAQEAEPTVTP